MIRRLLFAAYLILSTFFTQAQAFEPGLLVRSTGDTLRGEIENGFWIEPPKTISFRATPTSTVQQFQPRQLRAVSFTEGRYFRFAGLPIDYLAETRLERLGRGYATTSQVDSLLGEVLLEGEVTLLRVVQPGATHYFLLRPGRPTVELSERKYLRELPTGRWVVADANNYRSQLQVYFGDCATASQAAQTVSFTAESLIRVVQLYNKDCSPARQPGREWLARAKPRRHVSLQGGIIAGMRYNKLESNAYQLAGRCVDCEWHPYAGFYADLLQPSRTTAVYGELTLSNFRSRGARLSFNSATGADVFSEYSYQAWLGTARIGIRYLAKLPHRQQLLFTVSYELNKIFTSTANITSVSGPQTFPSNAEFFYGRPTLLPGMGVAWRYQRFTAGLDGQLYVDSSGDDISGIFTGTNYTFRAGLGYRLSGNGDVKSTSSTVPK